MNSSTGTSYVSPVLCCEDGRDLFGYYYGTPAFSEVFRSYGVVSYLALSSTALAWMISMFPVTASAHLYALVSLLIAAVAHYSLATSSLRRGARSRRALPLGESRYQSGWIRVFVRL